MKSFGRLSALIVVILLASAVRTGLAQPETHADKTLSPYFFVKSDDPGLDQLPLKSTSVKVNVSGVIADIVVTQVYKNEGKKPLEAIYIFPASTRAAVYGMKMKIGERTITAKIRERQTARQLYEEAKQAGKSASLLEQQRPNVFQMNVANILPSDVIKVELKYTELLVPTDAVYEFVYPTVVGPRYSNQKVEEASPWEKWVENPYLHEGESPLSTFDIVVNLAAGLPIQDATSTSHKVNIHYKGSSFASLKLDPAEKYGGNRDFVLRYRLAGGKIETGLLLFEGDEENFFLVMLQPPKGITEREIPPREYIFIVDVSGSMHGFPLNISKELLKDLIGSLRPVDKFNVLLFAGSSSVMSPQSLPVTPQNIRHAINLIERQRGGGGTELLPALKRALFLPKAEGTSRTVVIATDGYVTVEEEAFDLIRNNLGNANMFAFGIGSSVNRYIIEGMARVGMGEPFVITKPAEAPERAKKFRKLIESPVLTNIQIDFGSFEAYDVEPLSIPDVLADRPVIVFGKWRGKPRGQIQLRGDAADGLFVKTVEVDEVSPSTTNSVLRYLWARHRIAVLADYNRLRPMDRRVKEVTHLGLTYSLLTAYTSFVAIDTQVRLENGQAVTVKQPLPLPRGVSDYAVGNGFSMQKMGAPSAPSPSVVARESRVEEELRGDEGDSVVSQATLNQPASGEVHVKLGKIDVTEGISEETVRKVLQKHLASINSCFIGAQGDGPQLERSVAFTFMIDSTGRVKNVHIAGNKRRNGAFERCVVRKLGKLLFPAPEEGKRVLVMMTLIVKDI